MTDNKKHTGEPDGFTLDGQLLIAMPAMRDERFARSVIYVCAHSLEGAMGLIINRRADHIDFSELLGQLDFGQEKDDTQRPQVADMPVHFGGPVEGGRGFVLHSPDYFADESTLCVNDTVSLTATIDILKAIATGEGPDRALMALGYAGWAPGQLEAEIRANGWLNCAGDPKLVFDGDLEQKYARALGTLGVDPSFLVADAGHA